MTTNIIVVFPKLEDAKNIKSILVRCGLKVTSVCNCGAQALAAAYDLDGGIIISGYRFTDMQYDELYRNMPANFEMLLITSKVHESEAKENGVPCITLPLKAAALLEYISNILNEMARKRRKKKNQKPPARSEKDKAVVDEAKLLLMRRKNMSEEESFRYIQKCSMDTGTNMVETARKIMSLMG